ncbi:MAG TPA: hypothetical protein VK149_03580 [Sideroxyarcus sp.]|nr:hypothetical protein [Sideroxyarcus sp.]
MTSCRSSKHNPKRARKAKRYVPRHIHIPVMRGLRDEFGFVLHASLAAAEAGHFSKDHYDRIGGMLNTIWGALELRPPKDAAIKTVIEGAMRVMNQAGARGTETGTWELRPLEQAAIIAGISKAEEYLPKMDVLTLHEALNRFKAMQIEEELTGQQTTFRPVRAAATYEGRPA